MENLKKVKKEAGTPGQIETSYSRIKSVCSKYGLSPATVWRKAKDGTFPKPRKLSAGITAWKNSDLIQWEQDPLNYGPQT
jgi:predicted DNA-binding transcriptional regulator AlpA